MSCGLRRSVCAVAVDGIIQTEMAAQRFLLVFLAENAALLQDRNNLLHEVLQPLRLHMAGYNITVDISGLESFLNRIGDLLGSSDEIAGRRRDAQRQLTERQL